MPRARPDPAGPSGADGRAPPAEPLGHPLSRPGLRRGRPADELLASCYRSALFVADQNQIESIAFPAISTGAFGYPMVEAARVAFKAVLEEIHRLQHVRRVRFVLLDRHALQVHAEALDAIAPKGPARES